MRKSKGRGAAALLAAVLALAAAPQPARARSAGAEAGWGVTCVFANLFYGPGKMMYAFLGGFSGLVAYGLSGGDEDVALRVIEPAWRGDYALTPPQLRGEEEIEFIGRRASHRAARGDDEGDGDGGGASEDGPDTDTGWE
jgi:hypothetical protein